LQESAVELISDNEELMSESSDPKEEDKEEDVHLSAEVSDVE
jgi:hypothetical protein